MILRLLLDLLRRGPDPDRHRCLDLGNMLEHQFEALQLAFDLTATLRRQRFVIISPQLGRDLAPIKAERPVVLDAVQGQEGFDPVDVSDPLLDQPGVLAMRPSCVLFLDAWHTDEPASLPVTPPPGLKRPQQALGINAIGFDPPGPPIHFQARGIHDAACNTVLSQAPLKPKAVVAGFEHALDLNADRVTRTLLSSPTAPLEDHNQRSGVASTRVPARDLSRHGVVHRQQPTQLAQFDGHENRFIRAVSDRNPLLSHCPLLNSAALPQGDIMVSSIPRGAPSARS